MKTMKKMFVMSMLTGLFLITLSSCQTEMQEERIPKAEPRAKIAVMVAEGFHDGEAFMPMGYLMNQGYDIVVIGPERGKVKAYNSDFTIKIEKSVSEVTPHDFDALVLPGGRGPSVLRENEEVIRFVSEFWQTGKVTAAICHGPQVLITAGLLDGRTSTGIGGIKEELEDAGVNFVDESVVVDDNLITSRMPDDLHDFSKTIAHKLKKQLKDPA